MAMNEGGDFRDFSPKICIFPNKTFSPKHRNCKFIHNPRITRHCRTQHPSSRYCASL